MKPYLSLLQEVLDKGEKREDRTGIGTLSVFGIERKYDLREGFPLVTTKKVKIENILIELLWFLQGDTNIKYLVDRNVNIWNEWPFQDYLKENNLEKDFPIYSDKWREELKKFIERIKTDKDFSAKWGELGPVYGKQWRRWEGKDGILYDQIQWIIDEIKKDPNSRRLIVNAWNVADVMSHTKSAPPLCHTMFQFYIVNSRLDCQLYQRSADLALGVPYNIASYSALMMIIAQECGLTPGIFTHTFGDAHIYLNHLEGVREQLTRKPFSLPKLTISKKPMRELTIDDFKLENYQYHPFIKFEIAV
ncbi:MAG: thymidylate synthase [Patescibacteria group bacterium]